MTQTSRDPMITVRWVGNTVLSSISVLSPLSRKDKAIRGLTCGTELVLHGTQLTVHYSTLHVCVTYLINLFQINQRSLNRRFNSARCRTPTVLHRILVRLLRRPFSQHVILRSPSRSSK
jgi:hypothetical protein